MHKLFAVYDCPTCGEKLADEVDTVDVIDVRGDSSELLFYCLSCGDDVTRRRAYDIITRKETMILAEVSDERAEAFQLNCGDDDDDDYVSYGDDELDDSVEGLMDRDEADENGDFDEYDDRHVDEFCPNCGAQYDEIDSEFQLCHLCGHDNQPADASQI